MGKTNIVLVDFRDEFDSKAYADLFGKDNMEYYASKYTQIGYNSDNGDIMVAVEVGTDNLLYSATDRTSVQTIFEVMLKKKQEPSQITIVVVDMRDEVERRQLYAMMQKENRPDVADRNYTQFGYNLDTGQVVFGVTDGALVCYPHSFMLIDNSIEVPKVTLSGGVLTTVDTTSIKFKSIGQVINNK